MSVKPHPVRLIFRQEWFWLLLGLAAVMLPAFYFAHHTDTMLDEGTYNYKGYQFVKGTFRPYEAYGPWTNKMPVSFLIPGVAQVLFGPGLRTSRYYALGLFLVMLAGMWWIARRYSGRWVAVGLLFFIAFNRFFLSLYSMGLSQVLVACMLVWVLALTLGKERPVWQLVLGSILAGMIPVARENLVPFLPLLVLYLLWEHGWRKTWPAVLAIAVPFLAVHVLYWPEIMRNWTVWLPSGVLSWIDRFRVSIPDAQSVAGMAPPLHERVYAFLHAVYLQMPLWIGALLVWFLWPRRKTGGFGEKTRAMLFLSVSLVLLTIMHAYASVGGGYCTYCFENYMGFYAPLGWLLIAIGAPYLVGRLPVWRQALGFLALLVLGAGWGYGSSHETWSWLLTMQVPRMRNMHILPGTTELWRFLTNKFGWTYNLQKYLLPTLAGLGIAAGIVLLVLLVVLLRRKRKPLRAPVLWGGAGLFAAAVLVSTAMHFGSLAGPNACREDLIERYEKMGAALQSVIPPGAWVYWESAPIADLLYLPEANVFPPQLNQRFSFYTGGDADTLAYYGLWNQELADRWLEQADYLVVGSSALNGDLLEALNAGYEEVDIDLPESQCYGGFDLRIFKNIQ